MSKSYSEKEYTPEVKRKKAYGEEVQVERCENCGNFPKVVNEACRQCGQHGIRIGGDTHDQS